MTTEQLKNRADSWSTSFNISGFFSIFFLMLSLFYAPLEIGYYLGFCLSVFCGVKMNSWNEKYLDSL